VPEWQVVTGIYWRYFTLTGLIRLDGMRLFANGRPFKGFADGAAMEERSPSSCACVGTAAYCVADSAAGSFIMTSQKVLSRPLVKLGNHHPVPRGFPRTGCA